jgi:glutathione peroxidase
MRTAAAVAAAGIPVTTGTRPARMSIYDIEYTTIDGRRQTLEPFRGKVLLVVNVASECGFTPQYKGLEALYRKHKDRGFALLGFPCNQFGRQEPGDEGEIRRFCTEKYDITFPLSAKIEVNGPGAHPLFRHLKSERPGLLGSEAIKWNFTKFLVGRDGAVQKRYAPNDAPARIEADIVSLLG